jgi:FkbM family methyltransferase
MDQKRIFFFLIIIFIILLAFYFHKTKLIEFEDLIKTSSSSNCANVGIKVENQRNELKEINKLLFEMRSNYLKYSQNQQLGISKLSETLKILKGVMHPTDLAEQNTHDAIDEPADIKYHMKVYDLNTNNDNKFDCVKSKPIIVQTTICIHDIGRDIYVSGSIKGSGVWEGGLVQLFMRILNSDKDINVLDIGAQLGQYSLYAAKLGRKCVAVEPFYDSYIRLHKSILLENMQDKFVLITNGVSDKRGEFKRLKQVAQNVGGQSLLGDQNDYSSKINETVLKNDRYIIETILMDDLVEVLPKDFKKVIMKIDIEGYEVKAFRKASKLFSKLNVLVVFMEWMGKNDNKIFPEVEILELIDFFYSRNYEVRNPSNYQLLERQNWKIWPGDVIFMQKSFSF